MMPVAAEELAAGIAGVQKAGVKAAVEHPVPVEPWHQEAHGENLEGSEENQDAEEMGVGVVAPPPYRRAPRRIRRTLRPGQSPFRRIDKTAYNFSIAEQ
jgi:hypothetical protein